MSDIVERLREDFPENYTNTREVIDTYRAERHEAAGEILRLEEKAGQLEWLWNHDRERAESAERECERLRAALAEPTEAEIEAACELYWNSPENCSAPTWKDLVNNPHKLWVVQDVRHGIKAALSAFLKSRSGM